MVISMDFENFCNEAFRQDVFSNINNCYNDCNSLINMVKKVNLHAPQRKDAYVETKYPL